MDRLDCGSKLLLFLGDGFVFVVVAVVVVLVDSLVVVVEHLMLW